MVIIPRIEKTKRFFTVSNLSPILMFEGKDRSQPLQWSLISAHSRDITVGLELKLIFTVIIINMVQL
jgi:hypothetical protein